MADDPEEFLGPDSDFEADRFAERFAPLLEGESVLSDDRIHEVLGTYPRSAWSVVDRPDVRWAWHHHPLVFVPK
ncbi:MAG: hypothetical protein ABEJ85_01275 [Haloarculaceae archaeon]